MPGILDQCVFVIDQYIPLKKKVELIRMIKTQGGISVYSVSEKSTHLITSQEGFNEGSAKVVAAKNLGLHVVSKEFVVDSIAQGVKQVENQYYFTKTTTPQQAPSPTLPSGNSAGPPALTVTIPTRPAPPSQISPSPRTPPGFNIRAPSLPIQPTAKSDLIRPHRKTTRVEIPQQYADRAHPSPSPKFIDLTPQFSPKAISQPERSDDEDEDEEEDEDESSEEEQSGSPSFRDMLDVPQPRAWESATPQYLEDDGCKIFVGGIMFDDLEALKKTKEGYTVSAEVIAHIQKLKNERLLEIIRIFSRFGTVVRVKQFLEKRHIFITYDNKDSALQALHTLKPLEVRKKIVQEIRERLRAEDRQTIVSPRSNFYVRWPHHVDSEDGYSSRSYFSGSSVPSSPTTPSLPSQKLSWRQPQSPTSATYLPYQRSYFNNNFSSNSVTRSASMRSYFSHSESDQENTTNINSFSESEAPAYTRAPRYQPPAARHHPDMANSPTAAQSSHFSESDSDTPPGIRHRVVDRVKKHEDTGLSPAIPSSITPTIPPSGTQQIESSLSPVPAQVLLAPIQSTASITPYHREKRRAASEDGAWHKVIVLLLLLMSMTVVYFYNKG